MSPPRLSIPTRIFLGFVLVLGVFGTLAATSLVQHTRTARTLRLLHEGYVPLAPRLGQAERTQAALVNQVDQAIQEHGGTPGTRRWFNAFRRLRPSTQRHVIHYLERAERLAESPADHETLSSVRRELDAVRLAIEATDAPYEALFAAIEAGDETAAAGLFDDIRRREREVRRHYRRAWRELQERIASISAQAAEQERQAAIVLGVMALIGLVVGLLVTWWSQRVLKPLPLLQERVEAVGRGDDSSRLEPVRDDELGQLTNSFEAMLESVEAHEASLRDAAETQARLRRMQAQIVADLRAAIVVLDGDGRVRTVNAAAATVLGLDEAAVDQKLKDTGLFDRLPAIGEVIAQVGAGEPRAQVAAAPVAGHEKRFIDVLATPFGALGDDDGQSVLLVADDVTDQLATEARLIHTERLAAIGRMAAHVTHEVRNPLSSIGLNIDLLGDELAPDNTEAQTLMKAIQREIDRLAGITEEYLRLARLPSPKLVPDDVGELALDVLLLVRREMEAAGVGLAVEIEEDLPPVAMDEPQLRQALLNLLRNARESMQGDGKVSLLIAAVDEGVRIEVADEGEGIDPQEREDIFDLFYTTKERGTGLGLPLTQQIVVAHGGHIRCDGRSGGGTSFVLWLPAAQQRTG